MRLFLLIKVSTYSIMGYMGIGTVQGPTPANRGDNRGSVSSVITLRSYRRRTGKVPRDPSTPATNVLTIQLNCTSNYSHHGMPRLTAQSHST